ncbi:MAG: OmpA family protein [Bacteroidales bacterium]|jgi:outer membrane protein OmpA-like peptidoglycan-associated protein/tetratricopeptide (TPR) repeat protein
MKYFFTLFSLLILFSFYSSCRAQNNYKYTTKSKKAINSYEEATRQFDIYNDKEALKDLDEAIKADDKFIEAYMLKGDIYANKKKYELSIENYKKAIQLDPYFFSNNYLNVALMELLAGKYQDAKNDLEIYDNLKNVNIINKKRAEYLLKTCNFCIDAMNHPVPFNPVNMGDSINTNLSEYQPAITADEQTLVFTRLIPRGPEYENTGNPSQEDFYISHKDNDSTWSKAVSLGPPMNTPGNEGAQCFSPDGKYLYFTACDRPDGIGSCDLYYSKKVGDHWGVPLNMGTIVNSSNWDSQPSISSDGKTLYFSSNRPGGKGGMDIWKTIKNDKGEWTTPVNLGDSINTDKNEMAPFIHPDNQTLYFASTGWPGMGGYDIFYSRRDTAGNWRKPVNIGYPINTAADESYLIVNSKGDLAYFASDRPGGKGGMDIYTFPLYDKARPKPVTYMKGKVFNKLTKQNLEAKFELIDLKTAKTVIESTSDPATGEFFVCIPTEMDYALNVSKDGYLFYSENFTLSGVHSKTDPVIKDIPLQPVKVGEIVVLKNIFFNTDKYGLKPESTAELEKLIDLLRKNPSMKIEISGHTDNVGEMNYNQVLSENRAKAVYAYLISHGIVKERLTYKGYGQTKPIDTNATDSGKANNRRTEFKVIDNS